jgi:hypothetical protein
MQEKNNLISDIDHSDLLYSKYESLQRNFDSIKRKNHTWEIIEKKAKKKQSKIYIDFSKTSEKVLYSSYKKLVILKPEKIEKNELLFFINKHCKCDFNHILKWILPEKMRKGIKFIEINSNCYGPIVTIPEILFRNDPVGDIILPFPELLIPPFSVIFVRMVYSEIIEKFPEFILKTNIIEKIENFSCEIPIIEFAYINIPVNLDENNLTIDQCEKFQGIFKKFTVIFEDSQGNFQPINFVSFYWKTLNKLLIYRNIEKLEHEHNIYSFKLKNPVQLYKFTDPFEFQITLSEKHCEGILHLIVFTKNIISFRSGYIGKKYTY